MKEFVELRDFGFNILTIMFFITLFFTILQAYALTMQNLKIVKNKSGKSVSFIFFSYYGFSALAVIIYGLYKSSLALTINGCLGFIVLLIILNLLRFKKISIKEKIIGLASVLVIPLIILIPQKDLLFLIFGLIIQWSLLSQVVELWKNKDSGSVHPSQTIVSLFSGTFWLIYSIVMNIQPMILINSIGIVLWVFMLIFYLKFRKPCLN